MCSSKDTVDILHMPKISQFVCFELATMRSNHVLLDHTYWIPDRGAKKTTMADGHSTYDIKSCAISKCGNSFHFIDRASGTALSEARTASVRFVRC